MKEYLSEYRARDDAALERSRRTLKGQPDRKAQERLKAIEYVIAERREGTQSEPPQEDRSAPETFDERVARKYLAKLENARSRGIEFTLTLADMRHLMQRKTCVYTGIKLEDDCDPLEPQKRTLERIDAEHGYTPENTITCSLAANALKNAVFEDPTSMCRMTKSQLKKFVEANQ